MTKPLTPRDHPQPGDLNPQAEGEMVGNKKQQDLGIDPDAVLAAMVAHTLGNDRLEVNQANGIVIRSNMPVLAITPDLGPYYKVYKEIEKNELEKDPENGTMNTVAKAQKALFMMKVRVPFWDSMIPDPPLYDLNNELTIKLQGGAELTQQESFSIKCIAMHTTFVGKRGGFFSSNIPPVGAYVRVSYDNVKTLAGPQYLGEVELQVPPPEGFPAGLLSAFGIFGGGGGPGGCNGGLGNHPAVKGVKTVGKKIVKSIFGKDEKKQMQDEISEIQTKLAELDGKDDAASREARSALIAKKSELKAKLNPGDGATPSTGTDAGERRQDPTVPPSSPASSCGGASVGGTAQSSSPGSPASQSPATPADWQGDSSRWPYDKKLRSLDSRFAPKVDAVIEALKARKGNDGKNFRPKVFFAWRSEEVQKELVRKGNSKVLFSFHNATKGGEPNAYAADIVDKRHAWSDAAEQNGFWVALGEEARKVGLEWGGDWKGFKDVAHVQYHPNNMLAQVKRESRGTATTATA